MSATAEADPLQSIHVSGFNYSARGIQTLGASEYTVVNIAVDTSSSVGPFKNLIEKCLEEIVITCNKSPRKDNLLIRVTEFNYGVKEIHGFKELCLIPSDYYSGKINPNGMTALRDATLDGISCIDDYASTLAAHDYNINSILFVITDGEENCSNSTEQQLRSSFAKIKANEGLESHLSILIGLGTGPALNNFKSEGFDQYVDAGSTNAAALAKVAQFVSKSISSQSSSLGTGGPSQTINF